MDVLVASGSATPGRRSFAALFVRLAGLARRIALATGQGPLRPLWAAAYALVVRGVALHLRRGADDATIYLLRSLARGEHVVGLSDIDLAVVTTGEAKRERVQRRFRQACDRVPGLRRLVDLGVYEESALHAAVGSSILTHGLQQTTPASPAIGAYRRDTAELWLLKRPGVYRPLADWRRVSGPDRALPRSTYDPQQRRIAAWLELGVWWSYAIDACRGARGELEPRSFAKLIAEPARLWLWVAYGEEVESRAHALRRALGLLPEEEPTLTRALALLAGGEPLVRPHLEDLLPLLVRLSSTIAHVIASEVAPAGGTAVRLHYLGKEELVFPRDVREGTGGLAAGGQRLLPLGDWVARAASWLADEAFTPVPLTSSGVADITVATRSAGGIHPAVCANGLLVFPTMRWGSLRTVQCRVTDPVSFALLAGETIAEFPNVSGWSAHDSARRAVAEHAGWLESMPDASSVEFRDRDPILRRLPPTTRALGRLLTAARAAHFLQTLEDGAPELVLSSAALPDRLGQSHPDVQQALEEACDRYRLAHRKGIPPAMRTVLWLRDAVRGLPVYSR